MKKEDPAHRNPYAKGMTPVQCFESEAIPVKPGDSLEPRRGRPKRKYPPDEIIPEPGNPSPSRPDEQKSE